MPKTPRQELNLTVELFLRDGRKALEFAGEHRDEIDGTVREFVDGFLRHQARKNWRLVEFEDRKRKRRPNPLDLIKAKRLVEGARQKAMAALFADPLRN